MSDKGNADASAPPAAGDEERQQQVIEAVEAKIEDLEKEKTEEGSDGGAGGTALVSKDAGALVEGDESVAARERAAVNNALFAGTGQNPPAEAALLDGPSGASVKGGSGGAGTVNDLPPTTARTASARPPPQRNHKLMN